MALRSVQSEDIFRRYFIWEKKKKVDKETISAARNKKNLILSPWGGGKGKEKKKRKFTY